MLSMKILSPLDKIRESCTLLLLILAVIFVRESQQSPNYNNGFRVAHKFFDNHAGKKAEICLKLAKDKLEKLKGSALGRHSDLHSALELIVQLEPILQEPKCVPEELNVIKFVGRYGLRKNLFAPKLDRRELGPIDLIVYSTAQARAIKCIKYWPKKFNELYPKLDPKMKELAEFKRTGLKKKRKMTNETYLESLFQYRLDHDYSLANDGYDHVMLHSRGDPDKCNFFSMVEKYITKPCAEYRSILGAEVFDQLVFDAKCLGGEQMLHTYFISQDDPETRILMAESFAYNEACTNRVKLDSRVEKQVVETWVRIQQRDETECNHYIRNKLKYWKVIA